MNLFNKQFQKDKRTLTDFLDMLALLRLFFPNLSHLLSSQILIEWEERPRITRRLLLMVDPTMSTKIVRRLLISYPE